MKERGFEQINEEWIITLEPLGQQMIQPLDHSNNHGLICVSSSERRTDTDNPPGQVFAAND